ncbi:hypothetical protein IU459_35360 [Nocardia amamiensis]|uniref:MmyB-like transcription regulator ligand binding domain-containing protein n=1 Tax=Nocardia amamiensis TaxID=404578 RepID=A0ABS0D6I5_9NOCA|nr:hypothetical protein [Nocardia amamiensis]MBF6302774.1 hypothetical protein [Nocardia amamiensis]
MTTSTRLRHADHRTGRSDSYTTLPDATLREAGNLVVWHFLPAAQQVLADWDHEATQMVCWLKAILGQHRSAPAARALLTQLQSHDEFYTRWTDSLQITYRRDPGHPLVVRTADGQRREVSVETSTVTDTHGYIRLLLGVPKHPVPAQPGK